jgi:hypothetical protein
MSRQETLTQLAAFKQRIQNLNEFNSAFLFGIVESLTTDEHAKKQFGTVGIDLLRYLNDGIHAEDRIKYCPKCTQPKNRKLGAFGCVCTE